MSTPNTSGSTGGSERNNDTRPKLDASTLASFGIAAAVGLGVLMEKTEVRKVCSDVLQDPKLQKVFREAGEKVGRELAASWRRHGGMTVLADILLR